MGVTSALLNPYTHILRLARSGSPERAWLLLVQHGLLDSNTDLKALTLQARLVKDRGKRALEGTARARLFGESADLYAKAARISGSSYPLINAASLSYFAGKPAQAEKFARKVLDLIEGNPEEGETPYWREATRAEALLLLDQEWEARASLRKAIARQPQAWEDHAATIAQFGLILTEQGRDASWLDGHRPPASVHFSGISGLSSDSCAVNDDIQHFIARAKPGFAYGALAAGADLLFAQAFIAYRDAHCPSAELHVILPLPVDQFRQTSVQAFGDHWLPMFDASLDQAASTTIFGLDDPPLSLTVEHADRVAMGRAVRNAHVLASHAVGVTVVAREEGLRPQLASWQNSGRPLTIIEADRRTGTTTRFAAETTKQQLRPLLWASHVDWSEHLSDLQDEGRLHSNERGQWLVCDDLLAAAQLAIRLASASEAGRVAMLLAVFDPLQPAAELLQRAAALAEASPSSMVATDEGTAMGLTLAGWRGAIEEIGEIQTAWGSEAVWSLTA